MTEKRFSLLYVIICTAMFSLLFLVVGYNWAIKKAEPKGYINDHTEFVITWYGEDYCYDVTE